VWPGQKGKDPAGPILDPIVIIDGSNFKNPMSYLNDETPKAQAEVDAFTRTYLGQGQKYSMFFGGTDKGRVVVDQAKSISCETLTATLVTPVPLVNGQKSACSDLSRRNWPACELAQASNAYAAVSLSDVGR